MKEQGLDVEIQNEIRTLLIERKSLRISIKRLKNQIDNDGISNGLLSNRSAVDSSVNNKHKLPEIEIELEEGELEKRPKVDDNTETKDRHKRLLKTGLFNYLKRAKDALTSEQTNQNIIKHIEKDKLIDDKLEERQKIQLDNINKDNAEQLKNNEERLIEINSLLSEKYTMLMRFKLKKHYENMSNFIATVTQPTIFWNPRKYNDRLESLRNNTRDFIHKKMEIISNTNY